MNNRTPAVPDRRSVIGAGIAIAFAIAISSAHAAEASSRKGLGGRTIVLPRDLPESFQTVIEHDGERLTLALTRRSVRGEHFEVLAQAADGGYTRIAPPPAATYRGHVVEQPGTTVSARLAGGLIATLHRPHDADIEVRPMDGSRARYLTYERGRHDATPRCVLVEASSGAEPESDGRHARVARGLAGTCNVVQAELGIDASSEYYIRLGEDVDATLAKIEESVNAINAIYVRDAMIEHLLGRVVIRTSTDSDPYFGYDKTYPSGVSELIARLRNEWATNQASSLHDVAHLVTTELGGGAAAHAAVCKESRYGVSDAWGNEDPGRFDQIMRHELGHNWGAAHCEGGSPEGPTVMSGNAIGRFSAPELDSIFKVRNFATCLDDIGPATDQTPPYARLDTIDVSDESETWTIDVLANDHDANCDAVSLLDFDTTTRFGGSVALSPGTGPGGRDQLRYTPGSSDPEAPDTWTYTITDGTHPTDGNVIATSSRMVGEHDTYIQQGSRPKNYGDKRILRARARGSSKLARALVYFDLSSIPADTQVDSAYLEVTTVKFRRSRSFSGISAHRVTANWSQGPGGRGLGATWGQREFETPWGVAGGDFDPTPSATTWATPSRGEVLRWEVTDDVASIVARETSNYGWLLKIADENPSTNLAVASSRYRDPESHPRLVLETTPAQELANDAPA
jgi:hypothetical protein